MSKGDVNFSTDNGYYTPKRDMLKQDWGGVI